MALRKRCPNCQEMADLIDWLPGEGMDPRIRKFKCPKCNLMFYDRLGPKEVENARV